MQPLVRKFLLCIWLCLVWALGCEMADDTDIADDFEVHEKVSGTASSLPYSMPTSFSCSKRICQRTSEQINISGVSNILISADVRGDQYGQFESSDYLKMRYSVDGGSWVTFFDHTGNLEPRTVSKSIANKGGSSIRIRILAKTSAINEIYKVSGLAVKEVANEGEWKCNKSFYGTNDGCDCGCGVQDPDCKGKGCTGQDCKDSACVRYHATCPAGQKCFLVTDAYGGKWKDVEKDPTTSHDNLFCWVAGPSNILEWSGWGRVNGFKTTDDIFLYAQKYWPPDNDNGPYKEGDDAYDFLDWFFVGKNSGKDYPSGGGFHYPSIRSFPSYCSGDISKPYVGLCPSNMEKDPYAIQNLLDAGFAAALQLKGDPGGSSGGHVITLWGYSVDQNSPGLMKGVFLTDSDDDKNLSNPPDRLFHRKVVYYGNAWHILKEDGSPYRYLKYVYGLRQK